MLSSTKAITLSPSHGWAQLCHFAGAGQHFLTPIGVILQHATKKPHKYSTSQVAPQLSWFWGGDLGVEVIPQCEKAETPPYVLSRTSLQTPARASPSSIKSALSPARLSIILLPDEILEETKAIPPSLASWLSAYVSTAAKSYRSWRGPRRRGKQRSLQLSTYPLLGYCRDCAVSHRVESIWSTQG